MRKSANINLKPQTVVFRRWSRKRYAVFAGLHKNIVVGVIKADICNAALLKTEGVIRKEQMEATPRHHDGNDDNAIDKTELLTIGEAVPSNEPCNCASLEIWT